MLGGRTGSVVLPVPGIVAGCGICGEVVAQGVRATGWRLGRDAHLERTNVISEDVVVVIENEFARGRSNEFDVFAQLNTTLICNLPYQRKCSETITDFP